MDVSNYWKNRGLGYKEELDKQPEFLKEQLLKQEKIVIEFLKNKKFNSILEIGCGTGRYTKILSSMFNPETYLAIDISQKQIENAREYVKNEKARFECVRIQDFKSEKKYELVFASEVLMHIDFKDIEKAIEKLVSLSSNLLVTIDWFNEKMIGKSNLGYCFMHDYRTLLKKNSIKKIEHIKIPHSLKLKTISRYAKLRRRQGIDTQTITIGYI